MKILMVLTSHDQLGNTGRTTGFWLEEFAAAYFVCWWRSSPRERKPRPSSAARASAPAHKSEGPRPASATAPDVKLHEGTWLLA
jgi:hypothetical protein